jgi:hypothetical protein
MTIRKLTHFWLPVAIVAAAVVLTVYLLRKGADSYVSIETGDKIEITPEQIKSIRDIGQWEFLSVSDEELIDTVRRGFFSDDRLSRIYYGTMRLGVDLGKVNEGWISVSGDTVMLVLPPVGLLDDRFIDEAQTVSFFESGKWSAQDREAMYLRAQRRMRAHGLSPQNLRIAENHADAQFRQLLHAMGFQHVIVRFSK